MSAISVKALAQRWLRSIGLEVQRARAANTEEAACTNLLNTFNPVAVLDVGANVGQFGEMIWGLGYRGTIISFEPTPDAYAKLSMQARRRRNWIVAPCAALGGEKGEVEINISQNSVSSSILSMNHIHEAIAPESRYITTNRVRIERLDELALQFMPPRGDVYLKIDTQGYEREVLRGAVNLMHRVAAIQVELSLTSLYDGAPSMSGMMVYLESIGYELFNVALGFKDYQTGRLLQLDGFFVRKEQSARTGSRGAGR